jgi:SAM-dependent methyltransferase
VNQHLKADIMLEVRLNQVTTDHESQQAYDEVYSVTDLSQQRSFYLWMVERLGLQLEDIYLDVSCGRAQMLALAQERGIESHGVDLSHTALKSGRELTQCQRLVTGNSQALPYATDSFTVVSNIGSLEHYVDMKAAVHEMARVLRPSGRAIVLVPNTFSLLNNIWFAFRQGRTSIDPHQPIQRYGARLEWQQLLEDAGLVVEKTIKYERVRPRTWPDFVNYAQHPKEAIRLLLSPFVPLNLAFCFVFVCRNITCGSPETNNE